MWEEAYGYAGLEFLAKGIPVIANAIGGSVKLRNEHLVIDVRDPGLSDRDAEVTMALSWAALACRSSIIP